MPPFPCWDGLLPLYPGCPLLSGDPSQSEWWDPESWWYLLAWYLLFLPLTLRVAGLSSKTAQPFHRDMLTGCWGQADPLQGRAFVRTCVCIDL